MRFNNDNFYQWIINFHCNCKNEPENSDWILFTGFWNDEGFWRDTALWVD